MEGTTSKIKQFQIHKYINPLGVPGSVLTAVMALIVRITKIFKKIRL